MRKAAIFFILLLLAGLGAYAQQEKSLIHKGNKLYQEKKYKEAEALYKLSLEKKAQNLEGSFNMSDAMFRQKKFAEAGEQFGKIAEGTNNKAAAAAAYHNMGNSLMETKKLEEAVEAYKKSLIQNPKDEQTRYNLAYAQEKLKQQQQQNKNDKNKNKDKNKDKDKKDQDKDKKDDKGDKDKNKKDQDKKDQDNKDKKDQDKKDQDKKDQQGQKPQVSKEDAQRMLDALNNNEKQTQDKLKNQKLKGARVPISKNW